MSSFLLHAVGPDRPGIVAGVTEVLDDLGCNLGESRMTILHGQFAIMVAFDAPSGLDGDAITGALSSIASTLDLLVAVRSIETDVTHSGDESTIVVSIHGADRPGIVASITQQVAALGGNVVDLATRLVDERGEIGYVMLLGVAVDRQAGFEPFAAAINQTAAQLGVHCVVTASDDDLF